MFWTNTIWYVLLWLFAIAEIIIILKNSEDKKYTIASFFILAGATFFCEIIILRFLKAYDYFPMLFPNSRFNDGVVGNLSSQYLISATALMIAVLKLKFKWNIIFAAAFCVIEILFLRLGIYVQYWYRTWITGVVTILIFIFVKIAYQNNWISKNKFSYFISTSFGLYAFHMLFFMWIARLTGIVEASTAFFNDESRSMPFVALVNLYVIMTVCLISYYSKIKLFWKGVLTFILYAALYFANQIKFIVVKNGFFLLFSTLDIFGMYLLIFFFDKLLTQSRRKGHLS
jgi:hypothetical protein